MLTYQQTTSPLDETKEAGPYKHAPVVVTVQLATRSLESDPATGGHGSTDSTQEASMQPKRGYHQFTYLPWPTSKAGPGVTLPPPGQKPFPTRTDQMMYECYDQEQGMPCVSAPTQVVQEARTRTYRPDTNLRKVEAEAMQQ